jgi:hypothetical protein
VSRVGPDSVTPAAEVTDVTLTTRYSGWLTG